MNSEELLKLNGFENEENLNLSENCFLELLEEKGYNSIESIEKSGSKYYLDVIECRLKMLNGFLLNVIRKNIKNKDEIVRVDFLVDDLFVMNENVKNGLENLYFLNEVESGSKEKYYGFNYYL